MGLFAEHASRIFVACDQSKVKDIQSIAVRYGLQQTFGAAPQAENFEITYNGVVVVSAKVSELKEAWAGSLEKMLHVQTREHLVPGNVAEELLLWRRIGQRCVLDITLAALPVMSTANVRSWASLKHPRELTDMVSVAWVRGEAK